MTIEQHFSIIEIGAVFFFVNVITGCESSIFNRLAA